MKNKEASEKTITSLVTIARKHFTRYGYFDVSVEKIAEEGLVTRGAVYHHFKNKQGLFTAVLEHVQQDVALQIEKAALHSKDPWQQLLYGCAGFVYGANAEDSRRILLIDAPAVLGWDTWRIKDQASSMAVLRQHIDVLHRGGYLKKDVDPALMTSAISGALNELALQYASHQCDDTLLMHTISQLTHGFRKETWDTVS